MRRSEDIASKAKKSCFLGFEETEYSGQSSKSVFFQGKESLSVVLEKFMNTPLA